VKRLSVLCLGAHADDIEIGAGATIWVGSNAASASRYMGSAQCLGSTPRGGTASARSFSPTRSGYHPFSHIQDGSFPTTVRAQGLVRGAKERFPSAILSHWRGDGIKTTARFAVTRNSFRDLCSWNTKFQSGTAISISPTSTFQQSGADAAQARTPTPAFRHATRQGLV
jgi:hypothetical protein